jgi:hypothetical protein
MSVRRRGARVGISMKVYMLMVLVSMILASSYWASSDEASISENA